MEFPEGKVGVYTKFFESANFHIDLFNLINAPNLTKVKNGTRPRAVHEVPLLTVTTSRVIDMGDTAVASGSSRTPAAIEKSPLDFADKDPPPVITERGDEATAEVIPESGMGKEVATMGPVVNKRSRKRGNEGAEANAPPKVLRNDHVASRPSQSTLGGKSLAAMGIEADSTGFVPATQETPVNAKSVSDPDSLSYAGSRSIPEQDIGQSSRKTPVVEDRDSEKSTFFTSMVGSPRGIYQPGWGVTNNCRYDTSAVCQDVVDHIVPPGYFSELRQLPNDDFLSQYNINLARQVAMGSQLSNNQLSQQVSTLQAKITGGERIKAVFEEFKKYEDDRVNSRCAELDARLDALSIDFDEELRVFADVVSTGIAKDMSEGLKHGVEHDKAKVDLAAIEAYDPDADTKYVAALHALKDLKYPLVDQLEKLKDAHIDLIMASLFLESDSREDAP
nr:hypothetical protein [Tanacetum cinerariifolium]